MIFIGLVLLLGAYMVGRGVYRLFPVLQYYVGWRRDIYFMPDQDWARLIRDYLGGMALGLTIALFPILAIVSPEFSCLGLIVGVFASLALSTWAYRALPRRPVWVRRFEAGRAYAEVRYIRERGARALRSDPQRFTSFINSTGGWEVWLMTVV